MNLKDFFASKENPPELFWSLVLEPGWVQAGAWLIKDGVSQVLSFSPPTPWEEESELLDAVDAALSAAVQKLPEGSSEPTKTVFGVGGSWIEEGEISPGHLAKIKKLCTELSLTPTGFVVLPEAIAHLYKSEEGAPINAIILGLGKESLEISVFKLGNLVGTSNVARSVSLADDVVEGLSRFEGASPLPSRIIVFDGKGGELEEARDTLSGVSWDDQEKVKFLHTPKVEILESDKKVLATSLAGAAEIGQVSKVKGTDKVEPIQKVEESPKTASAQDLGFVVGAPVSIQNVQTPQNLQTSSEPTPKFNPAEYVGKAKGLLGGLLGKIDFSKINFSNRKKFVPLAAVLGVFVVGLILFWWFFPKASVTIYVSPKRFEEEFDISFDESEITQTTVSGEKTKSATGIKLVGERAKGSVSLRNGTDSQINFPAGTVLVSSGDLRFTLDTAASVSAAIDADNPGTTAANVTASDLGAEYNLAKDEVFKVGNYPKADAYAKSAADFSGGSSREISAVAADDQKKLEEELMNELSNSAKSELSAKASPDQLFVDSLVSFEISDESFNHKVGDEADTLKLDLSVDAKAIITNKQKLAEFVREKLKDKIPEGFVLRDTQIEYKFEFIDEDEGKFNFNVTTSVNFLPEVKTEEIIKKISGRLPEVVEEYLSTIPGFSRAEIRINPHFPGRFGRLPFVGKNITIEVAAER